MLYLSRWTLVLKRVRFDKWSVATGFATMLVATTLLVAGPMFSERVLLTGARQTLAPHLPKRRSASLFQLLLQVTLISSINASPHS